MMDQDVRNFLERIAAEEPVPFLDAEPLTRRAQRRAGRTVIVGALGVAAAIAVLFAGASQLREASPSVPATDPTPTPTPSGPILRSAGEILWYPFNEGDLLAVDPATGDARVLVEELGYLDDARWSADGASPGRGAPLGTGRPPGLSSQCNRTRCSTSSTRRAVS